MSYDIEAEDFEGHIGSNATANSTPKTLTTENSREPNQPDEPKSEPNPTLDPIALARSNSSMYTLFLSLRRILGTVPELFEDSPGYWGSKLPRHV